MNPGDSFVALEIRQLAAKHNIFGHFGQAELPDGAIGVLLVYNTEAEAQAAHPGAQIMRVTRTKHEEATK